MKLFSISRDLFKTTVARELITAIAGIGMVVFIVLHVMGNMMIFLGPEVLIDYHKTIHSYYEVLWLFRIGLIVTFLIHIGMALSLYFGNLKTQPQRYAVTKYRGDKTMATRVMALSGSIIFIFIIFHVYDFTIVDKEGPRAMLHGEQMSIYGVVMNAFSNPWHVLAYIIGVGAVGLHLAHCLASVWVSLGILTGRISMRVEWLARIIAAVITLMFYAVPIYCYIKMNMN